MITTKLADYLCKSGRTLPRDAEYENHTLRHLALDLHFHLDAIDAIYAKIAAMATNDHHSESSPDTAS